MWVLFALLSAFCETAKDIIGKKSSHKTDEYITAFGLQFFAAISLFIVVLFTGIPPLQPLFLVAVLGLSIIIPLWSVLYMKAVKLSPLSDVIPLLALNPILTALLAIFFEHRFPNTFGWLSILVICIGLYVLRLDMKFFKQDFMHPIKQIIHEPGAPYMLGVVIVWSIGSYISKLGATTSSPLFSAFIGCLIASVALFIVAKNKTTISLKIIRSHLGYLGSLGVLNGLSEFFINSALVLGFTPYVMPIKRTNIVWSSLMGKWLFHEQLGKFKLVGLILVMSGICGMILLG